MREVGWIVDEYMIGLAAERGCPSLAAAVEDAGLSLHVASAPGVPGAAIDLPAWDDRPVVIYGSFRFVRAVRRASSFCPGAFANVDALSYAAFGSRLGHLLLNDDFVILPFGEFRRRGLDAWSGRCFLRPCSVTKSFTGMVVEEKDFAHEMNSLERLQHVMPDDLVVAARARDIRKETRFVVVDGRVVCGSTYGWNGNDDIGLPIDDASVSLAREVAAHPWQPDRAYTCDVALVREGGLEVARLIELNSFSCASIYAADPVAIVEAVSAAARDEWMDQNGLV